MVLDNPSPAFIRSISSFFPLLYFALHICLLANAWGAPDCSRSARIQYHLVPVDSSSGKKGEGLRPYLEKDPRALAYLEKYQAGVPSAWQYAATGTIGTGLVLTGLLADFKQNTERAFIVGGISLILINFLVAKTLENANESNLYRAIDHYNEDNLPRIDFPLNSQEGRRSGKSDLASFAFGLKLERSF